MFFVICYLTGSSQAAILNVPGSYSTIQACANAATAGDTCLVSAGTFNEHVVTKSGGTDDSHRVIFKSQGQVIMQGFDILHPYVTVEGFDITGQPTAYGYIVISSQWNLASTGHHAHILNNRITGAFSGVGTPPLLGINFAGKSNVAPEYCLVSGNTLSNLSYHAFILNGKGHVIENNDVSNIHGMDFFNIMGEDHIISHNYLHDSVRFPGVGNHPDIFQTFAGAGESTISRNILIEKNFIHNVPDYQLLQCVTVQTHASDIPRSNYIRNWTFKNNVVANLGMGGTSTIPEQVWINNTFYRSDYIIGGNVFAMGDYSINVIIKNNAFVACGNGGGSQGWYGKGGANLTATDIWTYVTREAGEDCTKSPVACAIFNDLKTNGYVDSNGNLLNPIRALTDLSQLTLSAAFAAYKQGLYDLIQETISRDQLIRQLYQLDYNYAGGLAPTYSPKQARPSYCALTDFPFDAWDFCEELNGHGINGGDPGLKSVDDALGPDGIPFTLDDGLKPQSGTRLCGKGENGADIGAYSCESTEVFENTPYTPPNWPSLPDPSLILHYDFDNDFTTGDLIDRSDKKNNATCQNNGFYINNDPNGTYIQANQCPVIAVGPDGTRAAGFSGSVCHLESDYFAIPIIPDYQNRVEGTLTAWVAYNPMDDPEYSVPFTSYRTQYIVDSRQYAVPHSWALDKNFQPETRLTLEPDPAWATSHNRVTRDLLVFPDANVTGAWNHYAVTWNATEAKAYFNGTLVQTVDKSDIPYFVVSKYIALGAMMHGDTRNSQDNNCRNYYQDAIDAYPYPPYNDPNYNNFVMPNSGYLNGMMDDLRLYSRPLSDVEIKAIYNHQPLPYVRPNPTTPPATQSVSTKFGVFKTVFKPISDQPLSIKLTPVSESVSLVLYDRKGNKIRTIYEGTAIAEVLWNGKNDQGEFVASGVYLLHLVTPGGVDKKKVVVVK